MSVVILSVFFILSVLILNAALNLLRKTVGKNLKWSLIITGITFMMFVPAVMALLMKKVPIFSVAPGGIEEWIPFWGSYFGGIIGFAGVLFTTIYIVDKSTKNVEKQLEEQKAQHNEQLKIQKELFEREKGHLESRIRESERKELEKQITEQISDVYYLLDSLQGDIRLLNEMISFKTTGAGVIQKYLEMDELFRRIIEIYKKYDFQRGLLYIYLEKYGKIYEQLNISNTFTNLLIVPLSRIEKECVEVREILSTSQAPLNYLYSNVNYHKSLIEEVNKDIQDVIEEEKSELNRYLLKINYTV